VLGPPKAATVESFHQKAGANQAINWRRTNIKFLMHGISCKFV